MTKEGLPSGIGQQVQADFIQPSRITVSLWLLSASTSASCQQTCRLFPVFCSTGRQHVSLAAAPGFFFSFYTFLVESSFLHNQPLSSFFALFVLSQVFPSCLPFMSFLLGKASPPLLLKRQPPCLTAATSVTMYSLANECPSPCLQPLPSENDLLLPPYFHAAPPYQATSPPFPPKQQLGSPAWKPSTHSPPLSSPQPPSSCRS